MRFDTILPPEAAQHKPRLVLTGRNRLLIEQHGGVIDYGEDRLTVRLEKGILRVRGASLTIREYSAGDIFVSGSISSLEFAP